MTTENCIEISIASIIAVCQLVMSIMKFISNKTRNINELVTTEKTSNETGLKQPVDLGFTNVQESPTRRYDFLPVIH